MANIEELMQKYDDPFIGEPRQGLSIKLPKYEICVHTLAAYSMKQNESHLSIYDGGKLIVDMEVRVNHDSD